MNLNTLKEIEQINFLQMNKIELAKAIRRKVDCSLTIALILATGMLAAFKQGEARGRALK